MTKWEKIYATAYVLFLSYFAFAAVIVGLTDPWGWQFWIYFFDTVLYVYLIRHLNAKVAKREEEFQEWKANWHDWRTGYQR